MLKVTANQNKTIYVRFAVFPHLLESFYHSKFRKNHVLNNFTFFSESILYSVFLFIRSIQTIIIESIIIRISINLPNYLKSFIYTEIILVD